MRVRALAFDVVGTLMDWRSAITEALLVSAVAADAGEFADAWRTRSFVAQAEVNAGSRPWADLDALHLAALEDLLAERDAEVPLEQRHQLVSAWHRLPPWPDVAVGLDALRSHCVTAALSNGHLTMLVDLARHADLRFDCLLSAEMALVYKPAPEMYLTAARLLGVQPDELMLVAAHPADLRGARRAGLRTAFVDRPFENGPGGVRREYHDADESVTDLCQLAARLA
jgi:2-haloacid dehalogenase